MTSSTVIVIEDEKQTRHFLRLALEIEGYHVLDAETGNEGLKTAATRKPDMVIVDLGLPDMDGVEVVKRLREWSSVPVIILSARSEEKEKIAALDAGADDYLTKPFGAGELLARIRVALRRTISNQQTESGIFSIADLTIDLIHRKITMAGEEIHLTPIEYRLLSVLAKYTGKVLTHRFLLQEVWGPNQVDNAHYLRIYMSQLRHKLEKEPVRPRYILTEAGVGYRLAIE
ncbi:MAG: two-component system response regulator KdpE [Sulfuriferula sp.]